MDFSLPPTRFYNAQFSTGTLVLKKSIFVILLVQEKENDNIPSSDIYP